jgi:hypothetical protein
MRIEIESYSIKQIKRLCNRIYVLLESMTTKDFTKDRIINLTKFLETKFDTYEKIGLLRLLATKRVEISSEVLVIELYHCVKADLVLRGLRKRST